MSAADPSRSHSRRDWVLTVLVLALPVVVALGLWWWQAGELDRAEEDRAQDRAVVAAAEQHTLAWASVDYRKTDDYVEAVRAGATGEFLQQFDESEVALRQLLADNKSVQVPTIPDDGVALLERDGDSARVLVAMDAAVTNKSTKSPQPRQYRLQVELGEVDGQWLISGLEFIDERT